MAGLEDKYRHDKVRRLRGALAAMTVERDALQAQLTRQETTSVRVGPSACSSCGGEYGEHRADCTTYKRSKMQPEEVSILDYIERLRASESRERALREALQFYANPETWKTHKQGAHDNPDLVVPAAEDVGDIARTALTQNPEA